MSIVLGWTSSSMVLSQSAKCFFGCPLIATDRLARANHKDDIVTFFSGGEDKGIFLGALGKKANCGSVTLL